MTDNLIELSSFQNYLRSNNLLDKEIKINLYIGRTVYANFTSKIIINISDETICFLDDLIIANPYLGKAYIKKDFKFVEPYLEFNCKKFTVRVNDK